MPLSELLPLLARIADPRCVMVWRHGFDGWKPVEEVREIAQQLFTPPPLRRPPPPVPRVGEPAVSIENLVGKPAVLEENSVSEPTIAEENPAGKPAVAEGNAAEIKNVQPALSGIGGWLGLVAFGQVVGILRLVVNVGQYTASLGNDVWQRFPTAAWGELSMNASLICLSIYTAVLLFNHSKQFPRFFIVQMIFAALFPIIDLLWVAAIFSASLNRPFSDFIKIDPTDGGRMIVGAIAAAIWIPYVLCSRRVANTFTK
jgi:hypothetical protein